MLEWDEHKFISKVYDDVFDCVCSMSERYYEQEGIVPPTPEDADAFDRYNNYLNEVTCNAINDIISTFEDAGMTYEKAIKAFNDVVIDEFIDLNSAGM